MAERLVFFMIVYRYLYSIILLDVVHTPIYSPLNALPKNFESVRLVRDVRGSYYSKWPVSLSHPLLTDPKAYQC